MKQLYIFSISIMLASHTLRSAESDQLSTSPRYQALLPTPSTEPRPRTRCCSVPTCVKAVCCVGVIASPFILTGLLIPNQSTPFPPDPAPYPHPLVCASYSQAFAYVCGNNCTDHQIFGDDSGFWLGGLCPLPRSDYARTKSTLRTICPKSDRIDPRGNDITINDGQLCLWPQIPPPCTPWEPAIQKLNETCNPHLLPTAQKPTREQLRQNHLKELQRKHRANLTAMRANRTGTTPTQSMRYPRR